MNCSRQTSLTMEFPRQEYWSGVLFPSPGNLPNPDIGSVHSLHQCKSLLSFNAWMYFYNLYSFLLNYLFIFMPVLPYLNYLMAAHSSTLAWKFPWTEEPGGLQSMGSRRVGHDWATSFSLFTFMHWRRKWQPTPVFLPGESQGRGSLVGCRLRGHTESDSAAVRYCKLSTLILF